MSRVNFWILILDLTFKYKWITFERVNKVKLIKKEEEAFEVRAN